MDLKRRSTILFALFFLIILSYGYYRIRDIAHGPDVMIDFPAHGARLLEPLIEIRGTTKKISVLTLNDRPIFTDEKGHFKEKILLSYGLNIIKVTGKDRYERKTERIIEVIYKP